MARSAGRKPSRSAVKFYAVVAVVVAVIAAIGIGLYSSYIAQTTKVVTVCKTEKVVGTGKGLTGNIVYTSDGVYTYNDYTLLGLGWRWNSLDEYGKITDKTTYKVTSYGWRLGLFSWAPNILNAAKTTETPVGSCG